MCVIICYTIVFVFFTYLKTQHHYELGNIGTRRSSGIVYRVTTNLSGTVKLGDKELFDKEQIGVKEPFPMTNLPFTS